MASLEPLRINENRFSVPPKSFIHTTSQKEISLGHIIKRFREEKGFTQESLAKSVGIDRTTIARIECGKIHSLSVLKLNGVAQALGIDLKTLLLKSETTGEAFTYRSHASQAEFVLDYPEDGFRIFSLLPKRKEFFFGKIEIQAQKTVPSDKLPHPEQVFLHVLEGKTVLIRDMNEFLLKPGDCFAFPGFSEYELFNPDQLKEVSSFFITYPSFLSV